MTRGKFIRLCSSSGVTEVRPRRETDLLRRESTDDEEVRGAFVVLGWVSSKN